MSNFAFLKVEWPDLYGAMARAESLAHPDPRAACFYARHSLEAVVHWLYKADAKLKLPYEHHLDALLHEPTFRNLVGETFFHKARIIKGIGNAAVHEHKPVSHDQANAAVRELFHIAYWLARTYARGAKPAPGLAYRPELLPKDVPAQVQTVAQLQKVQEQLRAQDDKLMAAQADNAVLNMELKQLREEVEQAKARNAAVPDTHDYDEAATRDLFIDVLLREAGWALDQKRDREFELQGMPLGSGKGIADYVLWGDDGKPLGVVEAKRTRKDPMVGQQQAKLYADCLEKQFGQRPVIFYTNGYEHWLWDDVNYPPRQVQGFLSKEELRLLIQRRTSRESLLHNPIDTNIVERHYQKRAILRIAETFEVHKQRKALVVMATGAGKTRTVIALCDLLLRCNWAKRVLFLADRVALVTQAVNAFKKHLPSAAPVNLVTEKEKDGRVYVSTYPTMMGLIDEQADGQRRFGVGHFDLVVVDEAHRSVYQKYGAIFDYFDSLLVGLTATPRDEIDRNTYRLFNLEDGVPTDVYGLEEAVKDGFLVPSKAVSVPLKFVRQGITYDDLPEAEKDEWDAQEWSEDGTTPDRVEPEAVNRFLFNADTVDKALGHLMTRGQKVAGGDRLGKTIIFAKNQDHARFIQKRFDENYPHYKGEFARVIAHGEPYAESLINDFSQPDKAPHIAISVDMLDTGIDVPEVVNLVFFKLVRSKTKFWQMVGRGTRLCPDLFGPGQHKAFFYIFDYCQNLEFFSQNPEVTDGALAEPLTTRLFKARLSLIAALDGELASVGAKPMTARDSAFPAPPELRTEAELRAEVAAFLREQVHAMNLDNFLVRPQRRLVEKFGQPEPWAEFKPEDREALAHDVAPLPSELVDEDEQAKRFDLIMLKLQLARLGLGGREFERLVSQVKAIASALEGKSSIPMVKAELELLEALQTPEWWQDVTVPMLEVARKRVRGLVKLIDKAQRKPVYTDFEDQLGTELEVPLPGVGSDFERFRSKARQYLKAHENHVSLARLRRNEALTPQDLTELEQMLVQAGVGTPEELAKAKAECNGLGRFIRSLVGLDREAAKRLFGQFLAGKTMSANQLQFIDMVIDHLTEKGAMSAELLYESPFTELAPQGPNQVFSQAEVIELVTLLKQIEERAAG